MKFTNLLYANGNLTLKMKMAYKWRVDLKFGINIKLQICIGYSLFLVRTYKYLMLTYLEY